MTEMNGNKNNMKLIDVTSQDAPKKGTRQDVHKLLTDFAHSGFKVARVEGWTYANAHYGVNSLRIATKRHNLPHIKVFEHKGEIYLENEVLK